MNCKPGDLAYVVSVDDAQFAENIGHVVAVLRCAGFDDYWEIEAQQPLLGFVDGEYRYGIDGCIRDQNLRPISGVPVHDDIRDEVTA